MIPKFTSKCIINSVVSFCHITTFDSIVYMVYGLHGLYMFTLLWPIDNLGFFARIPIGSVIVLRLQAIDAIETSYQQGR